MRDEKKHPRTVADNDVSPPAAKHVGGINDQLGGVDPEADENHMRLAGGP